MTLYQIHLPYATFGIIIEHGKVVQCAPIARWARGKAWIAVEAYYRRKGATITRVEMTPRQP